MFTVCRKIAWAVLEPTDGPASQLERARLAVARFFIVPRTNMALHQSKNVPRGDVRRLDANVMLRVD